MRKAMTVVVVLLAVSALADHAYAATGGGGPSFIQQVIDWITGVGGGSTGASPDGINIGDGT